MKKYKSIVFALSILLLITFSIPQLALASWWNPFSWFKKEVRIEQPVQIPVVQPEVVIVSEKNIEKEIKKENKTAPVINPKKIAKESPVVKQEVKIKKEITPVVEVAKENYKLEDVIKEWRPYVVSIICDSVDSQGVKKSYSDGSGLLTSDSKGSYILTAKHVLYLKDGNLTNYCEVRFPDNRSEIIRIEGKDRLVSGKGLDKASLSISQPSAYVSSLLAKSKVTSKYCFNKKPDSMDDIVIMGYPMDKSKDDISYATGKIIEHNDKYYISSATITEGYSGGIAVSLKDDCYLGISTYTTLADPTKSYILDVNNF